MAKRKSGRKVQKPSPQESPKDSGQDTPQEQEAAEESRPLMEYIEAALDWLSPVRILGIGVVIAFIFLIMSFAFQRDYLNELALKRARQQNDWRKISMLLLKEHGKSPKSFNATIELAEAFAQADQVDAALNQLDHASELAETPPQKAEIHAVRALTYLTEKKYDEAIEQSKLALDNNPKSSRANAMMARSLIGNGQPLEAKPYVEALVNQDAYPEVVAEFREALKKEFVEPIQQ
ncbi:MAG: tetratricopeptide repeat protein [Candidatus Sumerlaeia bacterium]